MHYLLQNKPTNPLLIELCQKADELVNDKKDVADVLSLYLALSIYKLQIAGRFPFIVTDRVQINLFKSTPHRGLRIFEVDRPDAVLVLESP